MTTPIDELAGLLREAIEAVHQTGSIRDHADPNDKTGWNVHGIETCEDPLCVDALAALAHAAPERLDRERLARVFVLFAESVRTQQMDAAWYSTPDKAAEVIAAQYDRFTATEEALR